MIGQVLSFLQKKLVAYFESSGDNTSDEPQVVFLVDQTTGDSISFQSRALTILLINIEQEETLRKDNPFLQTGDNGTKYAVFPEIRLNLYLLVVANWDDYITGLNQLSRVIQYFQANRIFLQQSEPELDPSVEKLTVELNTLPFAEQNEVWNALRSPYRPSALFKVRMIVFRQAPGDVLPQITARETSLAHKDPNAPAPPGSKAPPPPPEPTS